MTPPSPTRPAPDAAAGRSRTSPAARPSGPGGWGRAAALAVLALLGATAGLAAAGPLRASTLLQRARYAARGARLVDHPAWAEQTTTANCGPAALASLLRLHGVDPPPLDSLAALAGAGPTGTTLGGLRAALAAMGRPARLLRVPAADLRRVQDTLLVWLPEGHFVVVAPLGSGIDLLLDPLAGAYHVRRSTLIRAGWRGAALQLSRPRHPAGGPPSPPARSDP